MYIINRRVPAWGPNVDPEPRSYLEPKQLTLYSPPRVSRKLINSILAYIGCSDSVEGLFL